MRRLPPNRLCNVEDFDDPELSGLLRELFPGEGAADGATPESLRHRGRWETAMTALGLRRGGALRADAEVLAVGAGESPAVFWLTNHVRRVFAVDHYLGQFPGHRGLRPAMLTGTESLWSGPWQPAGLVAQQGDMLELAYPDESFDAVLYPGSLRRLSDMTEIARALDEGFRVLKPGGLLSLVVDFWVAARPDIEALRDVLLFRPETVDNVLLGEREWRLLSPTDDSLSPATLASAVAIDGEQRVRATLSASGPTEPVMDDQGPLVRVDDRLVTSLHLALVRVPRSTALLPRSPAALRPPPALVALARNLPKPLVVGHAGVGPSGHAWWGVLGEHVASAA